MKAIILLGLLVLLTACSKTTNFEICSMTRGQAYQECPVFMKAIKQIDDPSHGFPLEEDWMCCTYDCDENEIFACGEYIRVNPLNEKDIIGMHGTYYAEDAGSFNCPTVGPDSMSEECKQAIGLECHDICG